MILFYFILFCFVLFYFYFFLKCICSILLNYSHVWVSDNVCPSIGVESKIGICQFCASVGEGFLLLLSSLELHFTWSENKTSPEVKLQFEVLTSGEVSFSLQVKWSSKEESKRRLKNRIKGIENWGIIYLSSLFAPS